MKLEQMRKRVDKLDDHLLDVLSRRFHLVQKIGELKTIAQQNIEDILREKAVLSRVRNRASSLNISKSFIDSLFKLIIAESKNIQKGKK